MASSSPPCFQVNLSFQGKTECLSNVTTATTGQELEQGAQNIFSLDDNVTLKLLYKGKVLHLNQAAFPHHVPTKKNPKVLIMASSHESVETLNSKRQDATIRGFDQEIPSKSIPHNVAWGPQTSQNKEFKFCRFQACIWQSFGHRAGSNTPHAFQAMRLLERLATDPGIVAIMKERELVVGTLGEMDPIDDRLKQKLQAKGSCLLGYNTNAGARIDVKLRPDSLEGFLPYPDIVSTLIHELSHNWVSEHNLLFWTNFGQMRAEYLHKYATLAASGTLAHGKTTAQLAGVRLPSNGIKNIAETVLKELQTEMAQHGLHPRMIAPAIIERCQELTKDFEASEQGQRVGNNGGAVVQSGGGSVRERALAAAEQRAAQSKEQDEEEKDESSS